MIVNDEQRRAMEFIDAVNLGGYRPTGREVNQWRLEPDPKPLRKGRLLEAEVPATPERQVRVGPPNVIGLYHSTYGALGRSVIEQLSAAGRLDVPLPKSLLRNVTVQQSILDRALGVTYKTVPGRPGKPAVYEPDQPPEKFLAHLRRLGWIERDNRKRYGITLLGRALLAAEAILESGVEDSSVVVLAGNDQKLGYGQVLGRIATCGDTLIADHYLGTEELMDLLEYTEASRFLIGPNCPKDRLTELKLQIGLAPPNEVGSVRQLRCASFHDRYIIGEQTVYTLTASLNGVSKSSMALLMEMTDVGANAIRSHVEDLWENADELAAGPSVEDLAALAEGLDVEDTGDDAPQKVITEVNGKFVHDGCNVQHRKRRAAENCTHRE